MKKRNISIMMLIAMLGMSCVEHEIVQPEINKPVIDAPSDDDENNKPNVEQEVYPRLILKADMIETYKQRFDALPEGSQGKKNKIVKALFSSDETEKKLATNEFISYWKNYSARWTEEELTGGDDGVALRGVWRCIHLYDIVKSFGYLSVTDENEFKLALRSAIILAVGNNSASPEIPDWYKRTQNIYTDVYLAAGIVGLTFPSLPEAENWVNYALSELDWQLQNCVVDKYCWEESPRYQVYTMKVMAQFMEVYKNVKGIDLFQKEQFKNMASWFVKYNTPEDKTTAEKSGLQNGAKMMPGIGDAAWGENITPVNHFASHYKDTDPTLSAELMWLWNRSGYNYSEEPVLDLLIDRNLPEQAPANLGSEICETRGYMLMRSGFNTDDEIWFMMKSGKSSHHEHPDKNSFSLIAYGTPFALDSGTGEYSDPLHKSWHKKTFSHNTITFKNSGENNINNYMSQSSDYHSKNGDILHWETTENVDYSVTSAAQNVFGDDITENRREVVFVKPDYFVIRDKVVANGKEAVWLMQTPCEEITWAEHKITCSNATLGTSLDIHVPMQDLTEKEFANGHFGTWTEDNPDKNVSMYPMKYQTTLEISVNNGEIITILHPKKAEMPELTVSADNGTITITGHGRTDTIEFTETGVEINKGGENISLTNN